MPLICIDVWSDYVCPFCYLELPVLDQVAQDEDVEVRWRAFELRPEPMPTLEPHGDYLRYAWESSVYPMARERGMTLRLPPVQPRSRKAHQAAEFARAKGAFGPMHEALFRAFFEKGRNIGEIRVLLDVAGSAGLDPVQLLGSLETRQYEARVRADQRLAQQLGIQGVPALIFHFANQPPESGFAINGAQPWAEVQDVIDRMKRLALARSS